MVCEAMPPSTRKNSVDRSVHSAHSRDAPALPVASLAPELQLHEQDDVFQHILTGLLPGGAAYHDPAFADPPELPFPIGLDVLNERTPSQAASTSVSASPECRGFK